MLTQFQKHKEQTKTAATIQQKSIKNKGFNLQDNRTTSKATQLMAKTHGKSCGCSSCSGATQMKVISETSENTPVTQLVNSTAVIQLGKICDQCGWEGSHKPGCTPQTRQAASTARVEAAKKLHDKSMDDRTRADQSHPQHGGDAKGRARKYEKWKK